MKLIARDKTGVVIGFVLTVMVAVSGLLAVQDNSSHMSAAVVMESGNQPEVSAATPATKTTSDSARMPAPVVENRMTEEAAKTAAGTTSLGTGEASFYGPGFEGRPTANGERFNSAEMTAAHRTLPFGSKLRVTNTRNGQSVVVRVNDRGPYAHNRVIDLSKGAAQRIGMIQSGTANVKLELIS